jgi:hypothetical protein
MLSFGIPSFDLAVPTARNDNLGRFACLPFGLCPASLLTATSSVRCERVNDEFSPALRAFLAETKILLTRSLVPPAFLFDELASCIAKPETPAIHFRNSAA